jgi:hypothetical protein
MFAIICNGAIVERDYRSKSDALNASKKYPGSVVISQHTEKFRMIEEHSRKRCL